MIKIAHIADVHLREMQYGRSSRSADFLNGVLSAIDVAYKEGCDCILCSGDVMDIGRPSPELCLRQLDTIQNTLRGHCMTMLVTGGNHDPMEPHWCSRFNADYKDEGCGIYYLNKEDFFVYNRKDPNEAPVHVYGLPYSNAAKLKEELQEAQGKGYDIIMWHGEIKQFCGYPKPGVFDMEDIPEDCCQVFAVGDQHIHKYQYAMRSKAIVAYPGSTELCSSDEDEHKAMWVYTFTNREMSELDTVPFPTRNVQRFDIDTEEDLVNAEKLIDPLALVFVKVGRLDIEGDNVQNCRARLKAAAIAKAGAVTAEAMILQVRCKPDKTAPALSVMMDAKQHAHLQTASQYVIEHADALLPPEHKDELQGICAALLDPDIDHKLVIDKFCSEFLND